MKNDFNDFRFEDFGYEVKSNKYFKILKRVSDNEEKCIVKVEPTNLIKTKYGYALILDRTRVQFLKNWQVNDNYYGCFMLLIKNYWNPKTWGERDNFVEEEKYLDFDEWIKVAKEQENAAYDDEGDKIYVRWERY